MAKFSIAIATLLVTTLPAVGFGRQPDASTPRIANARVTTRPAGVLKSTFASLIASMADAGWVGYSVPVVDGERTMCCFDGGGMMIHGRDVSSDRCCGMCRLEPSLDAASTPSRTAAPSPGVVRLEGPDAMIVLVRIANRQVERLRTFSTDCPLDAGGREVTWLTGVSAADSIALLEGMIAGQEERRDRVTDAAVSAIALHEDPAADAALERLLAAGQPSSVRARVPFWLGNARGRRGLDVLRRVIKDDPSQEVRKKAAFGISQSREPGAIDVLMDAARTHADAAVRGEAIFWIAQRAGSKAAAAITERIDSDPDTEVKKRAVFALSQLPKDESVKMLIQVARTNTNPAVRKQAIFWLGQSKDPRALDFFAEILK